MTRTRDMYKKARPVAVAFGAVALLGAIPAYAADVVNEEPPAPAPVVAVAPSGWAGPYVGAQAGAATHQSLMFG